MASFLIITSQMIQFFLILASGYMLAHLKIIHEDILGSLSGIIAKLLLPAYIFHSTYNGATKSQVLEGIPVLALSACMYLALIIIFNLLAKCLKLYGEREKVFQALFVFGNIGFVGIPLIQVLYTENGMVYVALFSLIDQLLLWTYGIWLTDTYSIKKFNLHNFMNPAVISILLSTGCILADVCLPKFLTDLSWRYVLFFKYTTGTEKQGTLYWHSSKNDIIPYYFPSSLAPFGTK